MVTAEKLSIESEVVELTASESAQRGADERGMTTAEYTVGTIGACSVAAVLIEVARSPWIGDLIKGVLGNITGIAGF